MYTRFIHEAAHDIPSGHSVAIRKSDNKLVIATHSDSKIGRTIEPIKEGDRVVIENGIARVAKSGE